HRPGAGMEQRVAIRGCDRAQLLVTGRVAQRQFREQVLPLPLQLAPGDRDRRYRADRPDLAAVESVAAGGRFVMDRGEIGIDRRSWRRMRAEAFELRMAG